MNYYDGDNRYVVITILPLFNVIEDKGFEITMLLSNIESDWIFKNIRLHPEIIVTKLIIVISIIVKYFYIIYY